MRDALIVLGMSALLLLPAPGPAAQPVALSDAEPEREPDDEETADVEVPEVWEEPEADEELSPPPSRSRTFIGNLSAYSYESCVNPGRCRTRTGTVPTWGTVAVDPAVVPLGSRLLIEQYPGTVFTALDTGGAVKGQMVDIWHPSTAAALRFGRQRGVVTVLD